MTWHVVNSKKHQDNCKKKKLVSGSKHRGATTSRAIIIVVDNHYDYNQFCGITALFGVFLETNKLQNLTRLRLSIESEHFLQQTHSVPSAINIRWNASNAGNCCRTKTEKTQTLFALQFLAMIGLGTGKNVYEVRIQLIAPTNTAPIPSHPIYTELGYSSLACVQLPCSTSYSIQAPKSHEILMFVFKQRKKTIHCQIL